jgi:hypothetical protein
MTDPVAVPPRLNAVILGVDDLGQVREFYTRLGWRARPRDGLFARFELGGTALVLFPRDLLAEASGAAPGNPGSGAIPAMILDSEQAIDDALAAVLAAGGSVLSEPLDRPWGARTAYFADPGGNTWELAYIR